MEQMFENAALIENKELSKKIISLLKKIQNDMLSEVEDKFISGAISLTSEFFRDLFSTGYMKAIRDENKDYYDQLVSLYDRSITPVENEKLNFDFAELAEEAIELLPENSYKKDDRFRKHLEECPFISWIAQWTGTWSYGMSIIGKNNEEVDSTRLG